MPVYCVWWKEQCRMSLVQAFDPQDLFHQLETSGDPSDVIYAVCRPSFVIDLALAEPLVTLKGASIPTVPPAAPLEALHRDLLSLLLGAEGGVGAEYSDVELVCEGKRFKAHRVILAARSEYFRKMFNSGLKETTSKEIHIRGISQEVLSALLKYVYTGNVELKFPNPETTQFQKAGRHVQEVSFSLAVLEAANEYLLPELKRHCEEVICSYSLAFGELLEALIVAERVNAPLLTKNCLLQLKGQRRFPLALSELMSENPLPGPLVQLICESTGIPDLESPSGKLLVELLKRTIDEDLVKDLVLKQGADVNRIFGLHSAVNGRLYSIAEFFLQEGKAQINLRNPRSDTPLSLAALSRDHRMIQLLLKYGARREMEDRNGRRAVDNYLKAVNRDLAIGIFSGARIHLSTLKALNVPGESLPIGLEELEELEKASREEGGEPTSSDQEEPRKPTDAQEQNLAEQILDDYNFHEEALKRATFPLKFACQLPKDQNGELFEFLSNLAFPNLSTVLETGAFVSASVVLLDTTPSKENPRKRALTEDVVTPSRKRREVEHFPVDLSKLGESAARMNEWGEYI